MPLVKKYPKGATFWINGAKITATKAIEMVFHNHVDFDDPKSGSTTSDNLTREQKCVD